MSGDEKNIDCKRHQDLTNQLKCIINAMEGKNPCAWKKPESCPQIKCPVPDVKARKLVSKCHPSLEYVKTSDLRGSVLYRCECIKRNGLQDRCMMWDCMGKPECMTKLYPTCLPGQAMLRKLAGLGDVKSALDKFLAAEQARDSALAEYCRLACPETKRDPVNCPASLSPPRRPPSLGRKSPDPCKKLQQQQKINQSPRYQQPVPAQDLEQVKPYVYAQSCPAYQPSSGGHGQVPNPYQDKIYQQPVYQKQQQPVYSQQQYRAHSPQRQQIYPQYFANGPNSAGDYQQQGQFLYRPQSAYQPPQGQITYQPPHAQMQQQYVPYLQNTFVRC